MPEETKSPAEELVDMVVFGPLGLALEYLENFPHFVDRGRKQAKFARSIGKMAVGGLGAARPTSRPTRPTVDTTATEKASAAAATAKASRGSKPSAAAKPSKTTSPSAPAKGPESAADPSTQTAAELIAQVKTLTGKELQALRSAEQSGKARVTVLRAIDARLAG